MDLSRILALLKLILPPLINLAEQILSAGGSGPAKKAFVAQAANHLLAESGVDAEPALIDDAIEGQLVEMKAEGTLGNPADATNIADIESAHAAEIDAHVQEISRLGGRIADLEKAGPVKPSGSGGHLDVVWDH